MAKTPACFIRDTKRFLNHH